MLDVIHLRVECYVERGRLAGRQLDACPVVVPLFDAVERRRLEVGVKFVGEEFRSPGQPRKVTDAEDTDESDEFAVAPPWQRIVHPVLKSRQEHVFAVIRFRYSCYANIHQLGSLKKY